MSIRLGMGSDSDFPTIRSGGRRSGDWRRGRPEMSGSQSLSLLQETVDDRDPGGRLFPAHEELDQRRRAEELDLARARQPLTEQAEPLVHTLTDGVSLERRGGLGRER